MDPVTLIVTALTAGAAAGLKPTAAQVVKDAYQGIKKLIQQHFPSVDVGALEQKPQSKTRQASVAEDLSENGADRHPELLRAAQQLNELIEQHAPDVAQSVGITIEQLRSGRHIDIDGVVASGGGIVAKDLVAEGDIKLRNLRTETGARKGHNSPKA